jgi:hypothetical protein
MNHAMPLGLSSLFLPGRPLIFDQLLHRVIVKRIDEINDNIRIYRLEIPERGTIGVTTLPSGMLLRKAQPMMIRSSAQGNG